MAEQVRHPVAAPAGTPSAARRPGPRGAAGPERSGPEPGFERPGWRQHPAVAPVALLVGGLAASAYLYGTDPHQGGHWLPRCPFNWATGLLCPACGGTRMVYDLLHGDVVRAFHENALLLVTAPLMLAVAGRWLVEGLRGRRWRPTLSPRAQAAVLSLAVTWTVVRNVH